MVESLRPDNGQPSDVDSSWWYKSGALAVAAAVFAASMVAIDDERSSTFTLGAAFLAMVFGGMLGLGLFHPSFDDAGRRSQRVGLGAVGAIGVIASSFSPLYMPSSDDEIADETTEEPASSTTMVASTSTVNSSEPSVATTIEPAPTDPTTTSSTPSSVDGTTTTTGVDRTTVPVTTRAPTTTSTTSPIPEITVPNSVNGDVLLDGLGDLDVLTCARYEPSSLIDAGVVIRVSPPQSAVVQPGSRVDVAISTGAASGEWSQVNARQLLRLAIGSGVPVGQDGLPQGGIVTVVDDVVSKMWPDRDVGLEFFFPTAAERFTTVQSGEVDAILNVAVQDPIVDLERFFYPFDGETQMIAVRDDFHEFGPNFDRVTTESDC